MAVYKRGDKGVFYMNFTVGGVRVSRSTGKFTKKEAKLVEAVEKKRMMVEGSLSPRERAARMLLSTAIERTYDERWKDNKDGLKSQRLAERAMELIGDMSLSKIDDFMMKLLVKKLEETGVKGATINRYLATMKTLLRHHMQPWEHIKLKKESKGRIRVLSKEEEMMVVSLLRNTDHRRKRSHYPEAADLVEVLVDTGCRLSEILNLKNEDINFDTNLISIWINKGDKPRSIPMTKRVGGILLARQEGNWVKPFSIDIDQAQKAWSWVRKRMMLEEDKEFVMSWLSVTWTFQPFVINHRERRKADAQEASQLHPRREGCHPQTAPGRSRSSLGSVRRVPATTDDLLQLAEAVLRTRSRCLQPPI